MIDRRALLKSAVVLATGQVGRAGLAQAAPQTSAGAAPATSASGTGASQPFDFAWLKGQAHYLASNPYAPSHELLPPAMGKLGYDQYQSIRFRTDHSLWGDAGLAFRLQFFHVGRTFTEAVHLYEVIDGQSRELVYDPSMFEWDKSGVDPATMKGSSGFCRFPRAVRHQLARRRRGVLGRKLFPCRRRRHPSIRLVSARAGRRHRLPTSRGISALYGFLVRAPSERFRHPDPVRPHGLTQCLRSVADANRARRFAAHERRQRLVPPQAHRALRYSAASRVCISTARTIGVARTTGDRRSTIRMAYRCGPARANGFGGLS